MYIYDTSSPPNTLIRVLGKVSRIDAPYVYLTCNNHDIKVRYSNLHKYTRNYLMVTGECRDGVLAEKYVDEMGEEFDGELFYRMVKGMCMHDDIY